MDSRRSQSGVSPVHMLIFTEDLALNILVSESIVIRYSHRERQVQLLFSKVSETVCPGRALNITQHKITSGRNWSQRGEGSSPKVPNLLLAKAGLQRCSF